MERVCIVSGARTVVGAFGGVLKSFTSVDLGSAVIKNVLERVKLRPDLEESEFCPVKLQTKIKNESSSFDESFTPVKIDEVIMGNVLQAAQGQNPARQSMVRAGLSYETSAYTVNKVCGSGLKAIAEAALSIMTGKSEVIIAGGQESMSNAPLALPKARWGHRMEVSGKGEIFDLMVYDGLYEIFNGYHMGITAENIADLYSISREKQDKLAVLSHNRAMAAIKDKIFEKEIVPMVIKSRKGDKIADTDERPMETDMEKMAKLKPAFKKDGSVTAGNASGINDGAAAVLLMSESKAKALGLTPLAYINNFASGGLDPAYMGLGPVPAVKKVMKMSGLKVSDMDVIELNEAFASQALGCMEELGIDPEFPNPLGSGISIGHPIGCTGARQMVTIIHEMERKNYKKGLISMCIGGGMGMAMVVER
ncbi:MAG: acetyl-CoA C-acetyltransferase [Desulfobacteraceae bacterium]|nr:acetyl-CoA C-acetyltransferase [Desulfobacteraceae bacterium]